MNQGLRKSGIKIIKDVVWGTHFCQFYQTQEDLMDILVPYFKAGLENNELCIWTIQESFKAKEEAIENLRKAIPQLDIFLGKGQIEIIPYTDWYLKEGIFDSQKILDGWIKKVDQALNNDYNGLRLSEDFSWLRKDWNNLIDYEEKLDAVIGNHRMTVLCTYSLNQCDATETIDVAMNHQFALVKREGKWKKAENPRLKKAEEATIQAAKEVKTALEGTHGNLEKLVEERTAELEKAHKSLREIEECLAKTQKMAHIGNWEWDIVTGELHWSDEVYRIFELDPERFKATYDAFLSSVHPDDREYLINAIKKGFDGELQNIDYRIILPDGEERAVHTQAEIFFDEKNIPVRAEGIVQDITERKRAEEALQEREEQYRAFFENSIDAVLITSPYGTIHAANPAACKIFGMTEEEITRVGRNGIVDISDPRLKPGLEERARTGKFRGELNYRRKDGTIFPGEVSSAFFKDKNGLVKTVMIIRDITERKQIE
jgi:PAS domain S-box-containing protein